MYLHSVTELIRFISPGPSQTPPVDPLQFAHPLVDDATVLPPI